MPDKHVSSISLIPWTPIALVCSQNTCRIRCMHIRGVSSQPLTSDCNAAISSRDRNSGVLVWRGCDVNVMGDFGIGQPVPREEDPYLVRGAGRYVDDVKLIGQARAYVLRLAACACAHRLDRHAAPRSRRPACCWS